MQVKRPAPRKMRPEFPNRPTSLGSTPLSKAERAELIALEAELQLAGVDTRRPRQLSECPPGSTPCRFASCRHSLLLEVLPTRTGATVVKANFPGVDVEELAETCSLRVARRFALRAKSFPRARRDLQVVASADEVARLLNLTPMRVFQIEKGALAKLRLALGPPA